MRDDKRTVFLSPGELFCIAGSLGLANLPLVGSHYRGYTSEQIRNDINHGREMLETRGLLKQNGPREWEVDTSLSGLIEFIAQPEYCLLLSTWRKEGIDQQVFLYERDGQGLSLTLKDRLFNLAVYKDVKLMAKDVLSWLAISQQVSANQTGFTLPAIDMKTLLDKAWDNSLEKVIEYLEGLGASVVDADRIAQAACQATNASNLTLIYPEEGQRFSRQGQLFFLNSPNNLWYTELIDPSEGLLEFQPIPATRAGQQVERYLRGMVGEDSLTPEG